mmetsp:Transcript_14020/g.29609  ORF Transcript_14020/g.29609 Transcript_14020/m.29609 type:complete len:203 (+) Transcript_14020:2579-3187(+)
MAGNRVGRFGDNVSDVSPIQKAVRLKYQRHYTANDGGRKGCPGPNGETAISASLCSSCTNVLIVRSIVISTRRHDKNRGSSRRITRMNQFSNGNAICTDDLLEFDGTHRHGVPALGKGLEIGVVPVSVGIAGRKHVYDPLSPPPVFGTLCHGRVCVFSNTASKPARGAFTDYIHPVGAEGFVPTKILCAIGSHACRTDIRYS